MSEDRSWALDPKYEDKPEFKREFVKRYPFCDSMPTREGYVGFVSGKTVGISGVEDKGYNSHDPRMDFAKSCEQGTDSTMRKEFRKFKCPCGREIKGLNPFLSHRKKCRVPGGE